MYCKTHSSYKGVRRPQADCLGCWLHWLGNRPEEEPVDARQLFDVLWAVRAWVSDKVRCPGHTTIEREAG